MNIILTNIIVYTFAITGEIFNFILSPIERIFGWKLIVEGSGGYLFSFFEPTILGLLVLLILCFIIFIVIRLLIKTPRKSLIHNLIFVFFALIIVFGAMASSASKINACYLVFNGSGRHNRDICYYEVAKENSAILSDLLCKKMSSDNTANGPGEYTTLGYKEKCFTLVATRTNDPTVCNDINFSLDYRPSTSSRDNCLASLANMKEYERVRQYKNDFLSFVIPVGVDIKDQTGQYDANVDPKCKTNVTFNNYFGSHSGYIGTLLVCPINFELYTTQLDAIQLNDRKLGQFTYNVQKKQITDITTYKSSFMDSTSQNYEIKFTLDDKWVSGFDKNQQNIDITKIETALSSLKIK